MELFEQSLSRALVLIAHPDDEVIGAGALLRRTRDAVVVFATDGAPRAPQFWRGFASRSEYANERKNEALQVLDIAGIQDVEFLADRAPETFVDQELFRHLAEAFAAVREIASNYKPRCILTLAYEGGHPDHDCCAFLGVQLAKALGLPVWEMPLYHRRAGEKMRYQRFLVRTGDERTLELAQAESRLKQTMLESYVSQRKMLRDFGPCAEIFRPQMSYDFSRPPHAGILNYEAWKFPMASGDLCAAFKAFPAEAVVATAKDSAA